MARDRKSSSIASGFYIPGEVSAEQLARRPDPPPKLKRGMPYIEGKRPIFNKPPIKVDVKK